MTRQRNGKQTRATAVVLVLRIAAHLDTIVAVADALTDAAQAASQMIGS